MTNIAQVLKATSKRREVELLLGHVVDQNRAHLYSHGEQTLTTAQDHKLKALLLRLHNNEPCAYLLNRKEFYGLELTVNNSVLIPRPETELLVDYALEHLEADANILDLGTGSGAMALALAAQSEKAFKVDASDTSEQALAVAQHNASALQLDINFILSDWFEALPPGYDAILCNPPYIAHNDCEVDLSVKQYEPHLALYSGDDGLAAIRHIISTASTHLTFRGLLLIEHGWQQAASVQLLFKQHGYSDITTLTDLAGMQRVTLGKAASPHE